MSTRPLAFALVATLAAAGAACGPPAPLPKRTPHAELPRDQVQTWEVGPQLAARKKVIVDTCHQAGRDDATVSLLLAMFMAETPSGAADERDKSKDGQGLARNISAFNANLDFLQSVGIAGAEAEALNQDGNLAGATRAMLAGLDKYGQKKMLSFHRGGSQARDDLTSFGAPEYCACMARVQAAILADRALWSDGRRIGMDIGHV